MSKILLINDCKFESMIMRDMLYSMGYEVFIASEYDALNKVKYYCPDIVIAYLVMKSIQGDELIEKIKGYREGIKCILSSSSPIILDNYKHRRVDAVIHTPINKTELEEIVDNKALKFMESCNNFKFCPYCGNKLTADYMFCPYCGKKIKD